MRKIHQNLPVLFQPEPWRVTEREFSPQSNLANETVFAVANGYLGLRGTFEEGYYLGSEGSDPAAVVNGIYEYHDYHYIWRRPGFPARSHNIVRQVNPIDIRVSVDGEPVMLGRRYRSILAQSTSARAFSPAASSIGLRAAPACG